MRRVILAMSILLVVALSPGTAGAVGAPVPGSPEPQSGWTPRPDPATLSTAAGFQSWLSGPVALLLTPGEMEMLAELGTAESRLRFAEWFWARRDPDPDTRVNEFRTAFIDRVIYADKEYGDLLGGQPGWPTLPGRLYLLLGPPTTVHRERSVRIRRHGLREITIWSYGEGSAPPVLHVPMVRQDQDFALLARRGDRQAAARLTSVLRSSAVSLVSRPDLRLEDVSVLEPGGILDASVRSRAEDSDLLAEIRIPLESLYGEVDTEGIRIAVDVELSRSGFEGDGATRYPIRTFLSEEALRDHVAQELHIVVRESESAVRSSELSIRVREPVSGREVVVSASDAPRLERTSWRVQRLLCNVLPAEVRGSALAFLDGGVGAGYELEIAPWDVETDLVPLRGLEVIEMPRGMGGLPVSALADDDATQDHHPDVP